MNYRQEHILQLIVEEYIKTVEPIGSKFLQQKYQLAVSSATIRHDMSVLEQEGYLRQPHTSAGRVPTEKAYLFYLQHSLPIQEKVTGGAKLRKAIEAMTDEEQLLKTLAKTLVDLSGETVIVAFDPHWSYYTGVSNLFGKPDFQDRSQLQTLSELIDQFDEVITKIFEQISQEPCVMIGSENPFGKNMSTILVKYSLGNHQVGLLGLVGPVRMDYRKNLSLIQQAKDLLQN
ncbi:MAG: Transcriptional regulator of heat shock protein [Candidatus Uhrbacteria bacterium GW2011_GWE2_40_58]|nr:MAG: Transcriptional regulator of heat shock protein [Candidatus Uhrbacteria bacterium GW2011_GWF2_40_263]KKR67219.1 MAG: Transcriptional regulator of heat shock protein [Candidatus Uhrbacteria bacterium GW2011_GWE2_40_58]OGL93894.1 MAG: hypothetical protein A2239_00205 [Candidatus Uhrbacteria bacterium RIFOXYA2_FULL_40_9]OGL98085.1 MAG: hypothetical protein A2332_03055 [Candidatus Uhrbacteria bacterium RIFOXYB2_FULL_41_18]HBK34878.1 hypothetical protein [Candidatus Uhrbacteria bacterium]